MLFSHLPRLAGLAVLVYAVIWVLILPPVEELQDAVEEEPLVTELAPEIRITEEDFLVDQRDLDEAAARDAADRVRVGVPTEASAPLPPEESERRRERRRERAAEEESADPEEGSRRARELALGTVVFELAEFTEDGPRTRLSVEAAARNPRIQERMLEWAASSDVARVDDLLGEKGVLLNSDGKLSTRLPAGIAWTVEVSTGRDARSLELQALEPGEYRTELINLSELAVVTEEDESGKGKGEGKRGRDEEDKVASAEGDGEKQRRRRDDSEQAGEGRKRRGDGGGGDQSGGDQSGRDQSGGGADQATGDRREERVARADSSSSASGNGERRGGKERDRRPDPARDVAHISITAIEAESGETTQVWLRLDPGFGQENLREQLLGWAKTSDGAIPEVFGEGYGHKRRSPLELAVPPGVPFQLLFSAQRKHSGKLELSPLLPGEKRMLTLALVGSGESGEGGTPSGTGDEAATAAAASEAAGPAVAATERSQPPREPLGPASVPVVTQGMEIGGVPVHASRRGAERLGEPLLPPAAASAGEEAEPLSGEPEDEQAS